MIGQALTIESPANSTMTLSAGYDPFWKKSAEMHNSILQKQQIWLYELALWVIMKLE